MADEVKRGEVLEDHSSSEDEEITTSVDQLLELLKTQEKIPLAEAAEKLGVGLDVVQSWCDFLVEEQIIGIEYKFTKPYIYLNQPEESQEEEPPEEDQSFDALKENFMKKAQDKDIPQKNIKSLWKNHVRQVLERKKGFFKEEALKRGLDDHEELWEEYKQKLLGA